MLINQTLDKLEALGLFGMLLGAREQLESSQYLSLSFDERLGLLVDREAETRDSRRLALRLKAAKLRQEATVEDLDFRAPRGLDLSVVLSLAQAGWVAAHHNLLITGPTGAGKSFVACALTHAAVRRCHTALSDAILHRLVQHAHRLPLAVASMRRRQSPPETDNPVA